MEETLLQENGKCWFLCQSDFKNNHLNLRKSIMNTQSAIGIVGGMGPRASLLLHERIVKYADAVSDANHPTILHISASDIPDRTEYLLGVVKRNPADRIVQIIEQLHMIGASKIAIPCNTSHVDRIYLQIELQLDDLGLDIVMTNMVMETLQIVKSSVPMHNRIGVLATNGSHRSGLYYKSLNGMGYEVIEVDSEFQSNVIHRMVYDPICGIKSSYQMTKQLYELLEKALAYFESKGCHTVLLGCTEFSVLPNSWFKGMTVVDPLDILARSLLRNEDLETSKA